MLQNSTLSPRLWAHLLVPNLIHSHGELLLSTFGNVRAPALTHGTWASLSSPLCEVPGILTLSPSLPSILRSPLMGQKTWSHPQLLGKPAATPHQPSFYPWLPVPFYYPASFVSKDIPAPFLATPLALPHSFPYFTFWHGILNYSLFAISSLLAEIHTVCDPTHHPLSPSAF